STVRPISHRSRSPEAPRRPLDREIVPRQGRLRKIVQAEPRLRTEEVRTRRKVRRRWHAVRHRRSFLPFHAQRDQEPALTLSDERLHQDPRSRQEYLRSPKKDPISSRQSGL